MLLPMGTDLELEPENKQVVSTALALLLKRILQRMKPKDSLKMYEQLLRKIGISQA